MLEDTIQQLKKAIADSDHLDQAKREQLLQLSEDLHSELEQLDQEHADQIAEKTHATVESPDAAVVHAETLKESVQQFEVEHPNLTRIITSICAQFGV